MTRHCLCSWLVALTFTSIYFSEQVNCNPQSSYSDSRIRFEDKYERNSNSDQWATDTAHFIQTVSAPSSRGKGNGDLKSKMEESRLKFGGNSIHDSSFLPLASLNDTKATFANGSLDRSSRFFSVDTSSQAFNLGMSFTIPFMSIPTETLMNFGDTTKTALAELMSMDLSAVTTIVFIIGAAILFIPKIMSVLLSFLTQFGIPGSFKTGDGVQVGDSLSSYTNYMRTMEVEGPFQSILRQIDSAMKEYNLDSTSCMQTMLCKYVADAEDAVESRTANSSDFIIKGIVGSSWVRTMVGNNAVSEAIDAGMSARSSSCSRKFTKCPFSLASALRLLATYGAKNRA